MAPLNRNNKFADPDRATVSDRAMFFDTDVWVFDLDNTLYPSEINLFAQVDARMGAFIARELGVSSEHARHLQKSYYYKYGTTLSGLMKLHGTDPMAFLDYVHDIDLGGVGEDVVLRRGIEALPGRKLIFTNGSGAHARGVASRLGVLDCFTGISSVETRGFVPKPSREAYLDLARAHDVVLSRAAMFEDLPHNLEPAHALGMRCVLVTSNYNDHPSQKKINSGAKLPEHVHFKTDNLAGFLVEGWVAVPDRANGVAGTPGCGC